jgi:hypothetical protein
VVLVFETLNQFLEQILKLYCVLDCHLVVCALFIDHCLMSV